MRLGITDRGIEKWWHMVVEQGARGGEPFSCKYFELRDLWARRAAVGSSEAQAVGPASWYIYILSVATPSVSNFHVPSLFFRSAVIGPFYYVVASRLFLQPNCKSKTSMAVKTWALC
jgi:hypothetical protein